MLFKKIMFFYQHLCSINLYGLLIKFCSPTTQKDSETISFPKYSRKDAEKRKGIDYCSELIAHS